MKNKLATSLGLLVGLLLFNVSLFAHHGGSEYDFKNPVTLKGTVTEMHWSNPHCQIFLDVTDDKGKVVNWAIETFAPAVLKRAGWTHETLHAGEQITVTVAPSKRGNPVAMIRKIVLADGTELTGGALGEQPPQ